MIIISSLNNLKNNSHRKAGMIFSLLTFAIIVSAILGISNEPNKDNYSLTNSVESHIETTIHAEAGTVSTDPDFTTLVSETTTADSTTTNSNTETTTVYENVTDINEDDEYILVIDEDDYEDIDDDIITLSEDEEDYDTEVLTQYADSAEAQGVWVEETAPVVSFEALQYQTRSISYTYQEYEMLCAVVMHEVGYCSTYSQQLVTSLVINRVLDGRFGNSIYEVLHAPDQFTAIDNYYSPTVPVTEEVRAVVKNVLNDEHDYANGALFYYAPRWCGYINYFESKQLVAEYDGQRFFK